MFIFLSILAVIVFALILTTSAFRPPRSSLSLFELKRRVATGDDRTRLGLERETYFGEISSMRDLLDLLLFLLLFVLLIVNFNWWPGLGFVALSVAVCMLSFNLEIFGKLARKLYHPLEKPLLKFCVDHTAMVSKLFNGKRYHRGVDAKIGSIFELLHLIELTGPTVLTDEDRKLLLGSMNLKRNLVSDVMTPRKEIICLKNNELLGPLVLDDLHKEKHRQIPVIRGTIDDVVGILTLDRLLNLDQKRSLTAGKAVDQRAYYIDADQNLEQALTEFLDTSSRLLIVTNADKRTVGLLTLGDCLGSLFGRRLR